MTKTMWPMPESLDKITPVTSEHLDAAWTSELLSGLSKKDVATIVSVAVRRTYSRLDTLFIQGHGISNLILLESGNVKHSQVSPNADEVLLRVRDAGDVVAGEAL